MMFTSAKISSDSEEEEEVKESEMDNGKDDEGVNDNRKKKIMIRVVFGQRLRTTAMASCSSSSLCCQADECGMDLRMAKKYHQRHKVCDRHSKAAVVLLSGIRQRFCQQCSNYWVLLWIGTSCRFHEISQFDDTKRSCRERLAGHNERRRKTHAGLLSGTTKQMPQSSQMNSTSLNATRHPNLGITNL